MSPRENPARFDVFGCPLAGTALIEASAGTGKTWTLCGLYLRLLLERRLSVQQILVVTFTNAATAELRERIRQRIAQTLAALRARQSSPETVNGSGGDRFTPDLLARLLDDLALDTIELQKRLELALQSFDEAAIFTIHGFCKRALDETPFAARMPLTLELLDDDAELRAEAVNDFWRRHVAGTELPAALAAALLAEKDTPATWSALLRRHVAKPLAETLWPARIDEVPALDAQALIAAHAAARALWRAQRETIVNGLLASMTGRLNANSYKPASVMESAAGWDTWLARDDALTAGAAPPARLALLAAGTIAAKTNKGKTPPAHPFFDLAQTCVEALDALADDSALARLRLLRRLFDEATAALREAKRARHVVAFDDMLYNLHERLHGAQATDLIATLRARFPAALIDEFQDTDPLQYDIFSTLYGDDAVPGPLFMVGDPKQAIYSFRNADLHTYLAARAGADAEYTLADNQRSVAPLIGALNGLFGANERAFMMDGLDYRPVGCGAKPRTPLSDLSQPDPASTGAALRIWTLPDGGDDSGADGAPELLPKRAAKAAAADACAGEIARLLAAATRGELLHGGQPLRAGEIAVLVRSHAQGSQMRAALRAVGVGSVELSQSSVFAGSDAEELDRVLAAILEPRRTGLLLAALATELIGLQAGEIEALAADEAALQRRMQAFADYRDIWLRRGIGSLLRRLYSAERLALRLLPRPDGERHLTDLLHLAELLHSAAETEPAPEALLRWFQNQRDEAAGGGVGIEAAQLRLESDRNLVQIVTVHKAKGLEFPIVFCPFLWDGRSGGSPRTLEGIEYHRESDGRTLIDFRPGLDDGPDNPGGYDDKAVKAAIKLETAAEHLRLIYVALTRAVHRCYLVAGSYTTGKNASAAESGHSLLNWLIAGAGQTPQAWFSGKREPAAIAAAWQALAAPQPDAMSLTPLPTGRALPLAPERPAPDSLAALPPPAQIPAGWRIGSYSGLIAGAATGHDGSAAPVPESAGADHDLRVPETNPDSDASPDHAPVAADDILNFPRGAAAGVCIHALFEAIDFTAAAGWPAAIEATLRAHPPPTQRRAAPHAAGLQAMLANMLDDVLNVPLPIGTATPLRLAELPLSRRLTELEFHLPAPKLDAVALNRALAELGYRVPPLAFGALEGYLKGFIDLVFEHEGRYFVLDWKSNHLGLRPTDYLPDALEPTMDEAAYRLQYLLYSVALDRYLARRLPDYDADMHFGGVLYLFVRGLRPGWRTAAGRPAGLFFDRPPVHALRRLSALLNAAGDAP